MWTATRKAAVRIARPFMKLKWYEEFEVRFADLPPELRDRLRSFIRGVVERDEHSRFFAKVVKTETCWNWIAGVGDRGYGAFTTQRNGPTRVTPAHRYCYEILVGPIPLGLVLDHLCRKPRCVNPAHLEPVTQAENTRRGIRDRRIEKRNAALVFQKQ
jgi:hypothetical protein